MTLKKVFSIILITGCIAIGLSWANKAWAKDEVLCSTFPVFLFTKAIADGRDALDVKLMIDSALGCPHDYAPTPAELERLSQAKVLVINGMGLESFLKKSLPVARNDIKVLDASGELSLNDSLSITGVVRDKTQAMELAEYFSHRADEHAHEHGQLNNHRFSSPDSAEKAAKNIAEGLAKVDPEGAEIYQANADKVSGGLQTLKSRIEELKLKFGNSKIIVSHNIFDNFADELGLKIVSYIEEEHGAEPSAAGLIALTRLARQEGVKAIFCELGDNQTIAKTLGAEIGIPVIVIDLAVSGPADSTLDYYFKVMNTNLDILTQQLEKSDEISLKKEVLVTD